MALSNKINKIETQQNEINALQKQIKTYGRTLATYKAYKRSGWDKDFFEANRADITLHKAAKKYFDEHNSVSGGKLPSINQLREQWAELEKQKRPLYAEYKAANQNFKDLCNAKSNARKLLGLDKGRGNQHSRGMEI